MGEKDDIVKRELRHKKRIRAQVIAYLFLVLMVLLIAVSAVFGVRLLIRQLDQARAAREEAAAAQAEEEAVPEEPKEEIPVGTISEPEPVPEEEPEEVADEDSARNEELMERINALTLEEKVSQLFFITPEMLTGVGKVVQAGDGTKAALEAHAVGGLFYNASNIQSESQLQEMLSGTVNMSKYRLFFAIEELGGAEHSQVSKAGLADAKASPAEIGAAGDAQAAYDAGTSIGASLGNLGFNTNWGPCADLLLKEDALVKDISYGADAFAVSELVTSMVKGLKDGGINSCLRFFPGEGSVSEDPAAGMAVSERSTEDLYTSEMTVYHAGIEAGAEMVLVGNASYPTVTGDNTPACLSPAIIGNLLRQELGFNGIVIAGPLNEAAVSEYYSSGEAAVNAVAAGADMLFMPENFEEAYNGLLASVQEGNIPEERINESLLRIFRVKY